MEKYKIVNANEDAYTLKSESKTLEKLICEIEILLHDRNLQNLIQVLDSIPDHLNLISKVEDLKLIANAFFVVGRRRDAIHIYNKLESLHSLNFNEKIDRVFCLIGLNKIDNAKKEVNVLLLKEKEHQENKYFRPHNAVVLGELAIPLGLDHVFPSLFIQLETNLATHQEAFQEQPQFVRRANNLISKKNKLRKAKQAMKTAKGFSERFNSEDLDIEAEKKLLSELVEYFPSEVDYKYDLLKLEAISSVDSSYQIQLLEDILRIQPYYFSGMR